MIDELIALLARLVLEGFITEDEAVEVLRFAMENGSLPPGWELPLDIIEAIPDWLRDRLMEALSLVINSAPLPSPDVAQAAFMDRARELGQQWASGDITLKQWHARMLLLLVDYYARQAQEGTSRAAVNEDDLFAQVETQIAFLSRFADQAATGRLSGAQVIARSQLYSGEGRAIFYEQQGFASQQYGWVEDYIAVDDRNTCGPCSAAEANGPYLPGVGPMPGRICLGRGYCRCLRLPRFDEAAYRRLGGT